MPPRGKFQQQSISLRKFDPATIDHCRILVLIGKRGTGKSTLVTDLLSHHKDIPHGIVMSATEESNGYWSQYVPELFIYNDFDRDAMERLVNHQRKQAKKGPRGKSAFVLADDCMYDKSFTKDTLMRGIFMNGRHWKILLVLTMQYSMDIPPALRGERPDETTATFIKSRHLLVRVLTAPLRRLTSANIDYV